MCACFGEEERFVSLTGIDYSALVIQPIAWSVYLLSSAMSTLMKSHVSLVTKQGIDDFASKQDQNTSLGTKKKHH